MPISVVEYFKLDPELFAETNAFNIMLDWDTQLFVDPFLLKNAETPEFLSSHTTLIQYFRQVLKLITTSEEKGDKPWRKAISRLTFREIAAFGLGYAKGNSSGSGIGPELAKMLVESMKEISDFGIKDPEMFELLGLFEDGFGPDRISDMTCSILVERFANYTLRVFNHSGYKGPYTNIKIGYSSIKLPSHPFKKKYPILLCPKELLRDLPTSENGFSISDVLTHNNALRDQLNTLLGSDWKKQIDDASKSDLKRFLLSSPEILPTLIEAYKHCNRMPYDFATDPNGEVIWRYISDDIAKKFPLKINRPENPNIEYYIGVVKTICSTFGKHIEENGLWELLFKEDGRPQKERFSQRLFFSIASIYCVVNNLDISPESNSGRGPVDFKFSQGATKKILVEIKLSSNTKLLDGYSEQVEAYMRSEGAHHAIFLVIQVGNNDEKMESLFKLKNDLSKTKNKLPEIITVNAQKKLSASKLRRQP